MTGELTQKLPASPEMIERAKGRTGKSLFPLVSASELTEKTVQIEWLIENFIEVGSLNLLFGEPGSGKSLFALDWGFCMAADMEWHDYHTKQAGVVIVAGEGFAGMSRRLKALETKYGVKSPRNLFVSQRPANFMDAQNIEWLTDSVKEICQDPGLIIIDTLHRNMSGDENSSKDIGQFINNIDLHFKPLGVAVLVVHHSGHGQKDRSRGSSSIRAAMDGEFSAKKDKSNLITLTCHKAKDFEEPKPLQFLLKPVELECLDSDGEPLSSVYLEYRGGATASNNAGKLSAQDKVILASLDDAIAEHGIEPTEEIKQKFPEFESSVGKVQKIVNIDLWKEKARQAAITEGKKEAAIRMAFGRCKKNLLNQNIILESDGHAWRVFEKK